jgi:hypothetical protein
VRPARWGLAIRARLLPRIFHPLVLRPMQEPIFPALIFLLMAMTAIATLAALTIAATKLIAALWDAINPAPSRPVVDAQTLAPIFDLAALEVA